MSKPRRLVLTREEGEKFLVGKAMIWVKNIERGRCRVVIEAPEDVPVYREEVLTKSKQAQAEANRFALLGGEGGGA